MNCNRGGLSAAELQNGKKVVTVYKPMQKGIEFCRDILEPYEKMFPRKKQADYSRP